MSDEEIVLEPQKLGPGKLVLVVGPSGAGKDTLLDAARQRLRSDVAVMFPARTVTRPPSPFEVNESITPAAFDRAAEKGAFALWWRAHEQGYGIRDAIDDDIRNGHLIVVNVSRTIIGQARRKYQNVFVVLITAPPEVLAERLGHRARESDGDLGKRLQRAAMETDKADLVISNVGSVEENARMLANYISSLLGR